jgi:hypothetical protein
MAVAAAADIAVKGIPVGATKLFQGSLRLRRIWAGRSEHSAPVRRDECGPTRLAFGIGIFRPHDVMVANSVSLLHVKPAANSASLSHVAARRALRALPEASGCHQIDLNEELRTEIAERLRKGCRLITCAESTMRTK